MYKIKSLVKRLLIFIYSAWFSLSLSAVSAWLAFVLLNRYHYTLAMVTALFVVFKIIGLVLNHRYLRIVGIIGLNVVWALATYVFMKGHPVINVPFQFPLFVLLIGVGISIKGRFNE